MCESNGLSGCIVCSKGCFERDLYFLPFKQELLPDFGYPNTRHLFDGGYLIVVG